MRRFAVTAMAGAVLMLGACGGSSAVHDINGMWIAQLNNLDGSLSPVSFNAILTQGSGTSVTVTNFGFWSSTPCFSSQTIETATFSPNGSSGGVVTGAFTMTITTTVPVAPNVLTLQGFRGASGSISGAWNTTGQAGCNGFTGRFAMNQPPPV